MDLNERCDALEAYINEGRLLRKDWGRVVDGKQYACLLTALSPEALEAYDQDSLSNPVKSCPVSVMPRWFAAIVPWLDDAGSTRAWPGVVRRFAKAMRKPRSAGEWEHVKFNLAREWVGLVATHLAPTTFTQAVAAKIRRAFDVLDLDAVKALDSELYQRWVDYDPHAEGQSELAVREANIESVLRALCGFNFESVTGYDVIEPFVDAMIELAIEVLEGRRA